MYLLFIFTSSVLFITFFMAHSSPIASLKKSESCGVSHYRQTLTNIDKHYFQQQPASFNTVTEVGIFVGVY